MAFDTRTFYNDMYLPLGQSNNNYVETNGYTLPTNTNTNSTDTSKSWLEQNAKGLAAIGMGVQGLSGLANAYMGYKNYQLAQEQFKFQKGLARRNLANQAKIINNTYDNAAQVAAGMIGGRDSSGNYGFTSQDVVDRYSNAAKDKHVSGTI